MLGSRRQQEDFLRAARRVRDGFAHRPMEMHRRLRALGTVPREVSKDISPERDFATLVMMRIQAGVLRYSDRQTLLAAAAKMGIGRFDANLLIAMAQHRYKPAIHPKQTKANRWHLIALAVAVQGAILSGFYWMLR
jgi:hypothetical protein